MTCSAPGQRVAICSSPAVRHRGTQLALELSMDAGGTQQRQMTRRWSSPQYQVILTARRTIHRGVQLVLLTVLLWKQRWQRLSCQRRRGQICDGCAERPFVFLLISTVSRAHGYWSAAENAFRFATPVVWIVLMQNALHKSIFWLGPRTYFRRICANSSLLSGAARQLSKESKGWTQGRHAMCGSPSVERK